MEITGRFHSYDDDDGRVGVCAGVCVLERSKEFVWNRGVCVCVCCLAKGTTGVHELWSWGVMRGWGHGEERSKPELLPLSAIPWTHTHKHLLLKHKTSPFLSEYNDDEHALVRFHSLLLTRCKADVSSTSQVAPKWPGRHYFHTLTPPPQKTHTHTSI